MTTYVALLADAVASRDLPPTRRARLQDRIRAALPTLNGHPPWQPSIAGGFAITLGDELQVLLTDAKLVWDVTHAVRRAFPETDWTVACGRGALTTALHPGATAPELDGPCFHEARAALERAKAERLVLAFGGFGAGGLHGFAAYYSALYWSWTRRQRLASNQLRASWDPFPQAAKASRTAVPSALSHLRRRMAWPLVETGDKIFRELLEIS
ncbi:MAG TPA: SatD family protein [Gemmatimonadales bacterium]